MREQSSMSDANGVVGTDILLTRFYAWHKARLALAFIKNNVYAVSLLSASNISPQSLYIRDAPPDESLCLSVYAPCCETETVLSDEECCVLGGLTFSLPPPTSSSLRAGTTGSSEGTLCDGSLGVSDIMEALLYRAHAPECIWCGRRSSRLLLYGDSLKLEDSLPVRAKCAAVSLPTVAGKNATTPHRPKQLLPRSCPPSELIPRVSTLYATLWPCTDEGAGELIWRRQLTYTGSSTSSRILGLFFPKKRLREEVGGLANPTLPRSVTQRIAEDSSVDGPSYEVEYYLCLLLVLYGYGVQDSHEEDEQLAGLVALRSDWTALIRDMWDGSHRCFQCRYCAGNPSVSLSTVVASSASDPLPEDHLLASGETKDLPNEGEADKTYPQDGAVITAVPGNDHDIHMPIDVPSSENKDPQPELVEVHETDGTVSPLYPSQRTEYTITISGRDKYDGHASTCPWRQMYLSSVLDSSALSLEKWMDFDLTIDPVADAVIGDPPASEAEGTGVSTPTRNVVVEGTGNVLPITSKDVLRLRFALSEVECLVSSWRASCDMEKRYRLSYLHHPLPSLLQQHLPFKLEEGTERKLVEGFLKSLRQSLRDAGVSAIPPCRAPLFTLLANAGSLSTPLEADGDSLHASATLLSRALELGNTAALEGGGYPDTHASTLSQVLDAGMRLLQTTDTGSQHENGSGDALTAFRNASDRFLCSPSTRNDVASAAIREALPDLTKHLYHPYSFGKEPLDEAECAEANGASSPVVAEVPLKASSSEGAPLSREDMNRVNTFVAQIRARAVVKEVKSVKSTAPPPKASPVGGNRPPPRTANKAPPIKHHHTTVQHPKRRSGGAMPQPILSQESNQNRPIPYAGAGVSVTVGATRQHIPPLHQAHHPAPSQYSPVFPDHRLVQPPQRPHSGPPPVLSDSVFSNATYPAGGGGPVQFRSPAVIQDPSPPASTSVLPTPGHLPPRSFGGDRGMGGGGILGNSVSLEGGPGGFSPLAGASPTTGRQSRGRGGGGRSGKGWRGGGHRGGSGNRAGGFY